MDKLTPIFAIINYFIDRLVYVITWIETHNALVTAAATIAIAIFTLALVWATRKLWKVSKEAADAAKASADAVKESVDGLRDTERAYVFIKVKRLPEKRFADPVTEGRYQARIVAINHGKTPATIVNFPCKFGVFNDIEIDDIFLNKILNFKTAVPPDILAISSGVPQEITLDHYVTLEDLHKITNSGSSFACLGQLQYKDIFGTVHETVFCWKDDGTVFLPDRDPKRNYCT